MNENSTDDPKSPGWDAINDALHPIYGEIEPFHYGTVLPMMRAP